jgi:hypothetical protein
MEGKLIELAEVICQLRAELDRARAAAADEALRFELGPIELEVAVLRMVRQGAREAKILLTRATVPVRRSWAFMHDWTQSVS